MPIRTAYKTKTKKLVQRLLAGVTLATFSLGVFIFMGSGVEAEYKRPVSQRKPVEVFTPVQLPVSPAALITSGSAIADLGIILAPKPSLPNLDVIDIIDPKTLRWSQTSAGGGGDAAMLRESMGTIGWKEGSIVDAIRTKDGITVIDNTRPAVALDLGSSKVPVRIHEPNEIFPLERRVGIFKEATSWEDALRIRTGSQVPPLSPTGSSKPPYLMDTKLRAGSVTPSDLSAAAKIEASLPDLTLKVKNPGLIEKIGAWLAQKFPNAAAAGESFLGGAAKVLGKLGPLFAVAGLFFGLLQMGYSGSKLYDMMQEDGIFEALGSKEGKVEVLNTLSGFFGAVAGGAFLLTTATAATVVGAPVAAAAGSVAVIAGALSLLFAGTSLVVKNWETIKATAENVWQGMKDTAVKGYRWVANSVAAAQAWAAENVQRLVAGTKSALQAAGKFGGELVRGTVQTTEKVVKTVTELVPKVVEYIEEKITPIVKTATRMIEKTVEVAREVIDKVVKTGERLVTKAVEVAKQVPRTIYETAPPVSWTKLCRSCVK